MKKIEWKEISRGRCYNKKIKKLLSRRGCVDIIESIKK